MMIGPELFLGLLEPQRVGVTGGWLLTSQRQLAPTLIVLVSVLGSTMRSVINYGLSAILLGKVTTMEKC